MCWQLLKRFFAPAVDYILKSWIDMGKDKLMPVLLPSRRHLLHKFKEDCEFLADQVDVDAQDIGKKPTSGDLGCITFIFIDSVRG